MRPHQRWNLVEEQDMSLILKASAPINKETVPQVAYDWCPLDSETTKHEFYTSRSYGNLKPLLDAGDTLTWTMQWREAADDKSSLS